MALAALVTQPVFRTSRQFFIGLGDLQHPALERGSVSSSARVRPDGTTAANISSRARRGVEKLVKIGKNWSAVGQCSKPIHHALSAPRSLLGVSLLPSLKKVFGFSACAIRAISRAMSSVPLSGVTAM
jgi:hypothetical protein